MAILWYDIFNTYTENSVDVIYEYMYCNTVKVETYDAFPMSFFPLSQWTLHEIFTIIFHGIGKMICILSSTILMWIVLIMYYTTEF